MYPGNPFNKLIAFKNSKYFLFTFYFCYIFLIFCYQTGPSISELYFNVNIEFLDSHPHLHCQTPQLFSTSFLYPLITYTISNISFGFLVSFFYSLISSVSSFKSLNPLSVKPTRILFFFCIIF